MRLLITLLSIAIIISGCFRKRQKTTDKTEELYPTKQADTTYANHEPDPHRLQLKRDMSYGTTDSVVVGDIAAFVVDDQNRVLIADKDQTVIHVFNPDGSYLKSVGRQGKGPGEFSGFHFENAMMLHANQLFVTGTNFYFLNRANIFKLNDLSFSHSIKLLAKNKDDYEELKGYYPKQIFPRNDGRFLVAYQRSPHTYRDSLSFIRYMVEDSNAAIVSGPVLVQKDQVNLTYKVPNSGIDYTIMHSFPFFGKSLLAVSSKGHIYAVSDTQEFQINVYDQDGNHLRTIQFSFNNVPLSRDKLMERYKKTGYMSELGDGVAIKMVREAHNLPETWPALWSMFFDDQDRLWVSTFISDPDLYEWWVMNKKGKVLAKFTWPRNKKVRSVRNGYLYDLEKDEEGVENVVRYKVEW